MGYEHRIISTTDVTNYTDFACNATRERAIHCLVPERQKKNQWCPLKDCKLSQGHQPTSALKEYLFLRGGQLTDYKVVK